MKRNDLILSVASGLFTHCISNDILEEAEIPSFKYRLDTAKEVLKIAKDSADAAKELGLLEK